MRELQEVVDRYIGTWNETDPAKRRELIGRTWTEDGTYLDPLMAGEGQEEIDAMIEAVQANSRGTSSAARAKSTRTTTGCASPGSSVRTVPPAGRRPRRRGDRRRSITGFLDFTPSPNGQ